jgi:hypothetical protein
MSYQIPYEDATFTPDDDLIPGNLQADNPVKFELVPAGGPDLARLKSVLFAAAGLTNNGVWSPEMQAAVIGSFESGSGVFERCITAIHGFNIPAALAVRVGILNAVPVRADDEGKVRPDPKAPVPITNGVEFSKIAGFQTALALAVAFEIMKISKQVNALDPRLFAQPSGSPSAETAGGQTGTVRRVRKGPGRPGTAV